MSVTNLLMDISVKLAASREMKIKNINNLLSQVYSDVSALRKAQDRFAEQLAPDFRIFDYLRTDEYGLSRCLADLLNPKGKHGQGRLFLNMFLERINAMDWAGIDQCPEVKLEKTIENNRRIDIYLKFKNGVMGIENKPWAGDQNLQLSAYARWLKNSAKNGNWILVFLSNRDPNEFSIELEERESYEKDGNFIRLSYHNVIEWLEMCAAKAKALTVRIFIEELMKFIRTHVNQEIEMNEAQEIKNSVLETENKFEAAWLVSRSFQDILINLRENFKKDIQDKLKNKGYKIEYNKEFFNGREGYDFGILRDDLQDVRLVFGFEVKWFHDLYWGIARRSKNVVKSEEKINKIKNIMINFFGSPEGFDADYFWYVHAKDEEFDFRDWNNYKTYWAMKEGLLADKIVEIADEVYEKFISDMDLLMPETTSKED